MKLVEAGKTSQGRTMYFALISTPENLAKIDRYREIARRLAHPQGLTDAEARKLAPDGKAFVHIDGGLHATEVAGRPQTPLLAYDLVSRANDPDIKAILDNVVVMLWPTINPDGQQMVAEWYMKNVGTPYELSGLPRLYQEYVGHDNNRDAYMLNMIESRVLEHTWRQWEPQIIYVHHQSAPFPTRIWLPPFSGAGRHRRAVPDVARGQHDRHGDREGARRARAGRAPRTWARRSTRGIPGYIDYAPNFKNIAAFWTETALYPVRDAARLHDRRLSAEHARPAAAEPVLEPVAAGLVAAARRGRLHGDGVALRARIRREIQGLAAVRSLQGRARSDRARDARRRRTRTSSRRISAIPSPRSSCCAASRSAACACRS